MARAPLTCAAAFGALLAARGAWADGGCARPTDAAGIDDYAYGTATVQSFGNDSVLVWYATDGAHAVDTTSTRADGVPDDVADVAQVTADTLARYAIMGYRAPVSDAVNPACGSNGGDGRLDVYLVHMTGADGMTVAEAGRCTTAGTASSCASFLIVQARFADLYRTADLGVRTVLPHETFHAVQNAYDAGLDRFWAEGTAQWAVKTLDPTLTDLERFLPAFFSQTSRALDGPAGGVTSAYLYGAAVWPVFLTARHGDDIVRAILEQEASAGGPAITATDLALQAVGSSVAAEFPLFATWNAATGSRTGVGGYPNGAAYPLSPLSDFTASGGQGITSGLASFIYFAKLDAPADIALDGDPARNAGMWLPFESGVARVDQAVPLPARATGNGIIVVSGTTSNKTDAPFTVSVTTVSTPGNGGGCAVMATGGNPGKTEVGVVVLSCLLYWRRAGRRR
ncbi:MAG TPA: MXAN_6640 family putative metalloprotease [Polyangia bacterium]|jgi:hypothetical protein